MRSFLLPAVEAGEGGGRDFHAVELDEGEEEVPNCWIWEEWSCLPVSVQRLLGIDFIRALALIC